MKRLKLVVIAGEASGDGLAGAMMDGLQARGYSLSLSGIGGAALLSRGLEPVVPMESLTVLGVGQAIRSISRLNKLADRLIDHVLNERPDAVLTIDSKGFNLRFARRLKNRMNERGWHAPVIHAVAPTVWAWGSWRAASVARSVDRLLCLFPFEPRYFSPYGADAVAIGHPAAERVQPTKVEARDTLGFDQVTPVLALLPGSRSGEIKRLLPDMVRAFQLVKAEMPQLRAVLPMADHVAPLITSMMPGDASILTVWQDDLDRAMVAADYGLICSGTVTLEAALCGLRGHVYYRSDPVSTLVGRMLVRRDSIVLPNVISGKEIYPFSLGREFTATDMADAALKGMKRGGEATAGHAENLRQKLTVEGGFYDAAARAILEMTESRA